MSGQAPSAALLARIDQMTPDQRSLLASFLLRMTPEASTPDEVRYLRSLASHALRVHLTEAPDLSTDLAEGRACIVQPLPSVAF